MIRFKPDNKGVSLPMTIGLMLLLVTITATLNELVIRALRASHQIEASDKAYFAAEAGVENALYELSAHTAGYQTAPLGDLNARNDDFAGTVSWNNEWEIAGRNLNACDSLMDDWAVPSFNPSYCGRLFEGQKLVINLFSDDADSVGNGTDQINEAAPVINKIHLSDFKLVFRFPPSVIAANSVAFAGLQPLSIDNDGDYDSGSGTGLNEDGPAEFDGKQNCAYSPLVEVDDNDCDSKEDEDSTRDPVLLWKLVDDQGHSFQPLRGCKTDSQHASHPNPGDTNATLCEKDFLKTINELSVFITEADRGINQDGMITDVASFIADMPLDSQLQMEILVVAPLQHVNTTDRYKVPLLYLEYGLEYTAGGLDIPATFFSIRSDGFFQDFKQSITTNVVPRATTKLLDLTIIQQ